MSNDCHMVENTKSNRASGALPVREEGSEVQAAREGSDHHLLLPVGF
jgi:hypothetical protein